MSKTFSPSVPELHLAVTSRGRKQTLGLDFFCLKSKRSSQGQFDVTWFDRILQSHPTERRADVQSPTVVNTKTTAGHVFLLNIEN